MCRFTSDRSGAGEPSARAPAVCLIAFCAPMALPPGPGGDLSECRIAAIVTSSRAFSSAAVARFTGRFGFFPPLTMSNSGMYSAYLAESATLTVSGIPVSLPMVLMLYSGWTWISNPYQQPIALPEGVPIFSFSQGDQIKSQSEFAEYYAGFGWFGTLMSLQPGSGYKVRVAGGGTATFQAGR